MFKRRLYSFLSFIGEVLKMTLISLAIVLPIRYFLIQPFYVKGASMEPTFYDHEYLIIDEITYRFREPERGEVIVFRYPMAPNQYFIKRLIGLPGEKIKIQNNQITITDTQGKEFVLNEPYLSFQDSPKHLDTEIELKEDEYFVLGDNRSESFDSRFFGPVKRKYIVGRVWLRGWPFNRITKFTPPNYNYAK